MSNRQTHRANALPIPFMLIAMQDEEERRAAPHRSSGPFPEVRPSYAYQSAIEPDQVGHLDFILTIALTVL